MGGRRSVAVAGAAILVASATVALVLALTLASTSTSASASASVGRQAAAAGDPSCTTAQLDVTFVDKPNGGAGAIYYPIQFTNRGIHACMLRGYPGVSAVSSRGVQIGSPAIRSGAAERTVTLQPSQSTSSMVGFSDTANFPAAKCKPVTARGLRVIPPNQTSSVILKRRFAACAGTSVDVLTVLPVK